LAGFLDQLIMFPTVIFTVLMGVTVLYWMLVIFGAFGMPSVDLDVGIDGAVEGSVEGAVEGATEGLKAGASSFEGIFHALRLKSVPLTLSGSLLVFWMWVSCIAGNMFLRPLLGGWASAAVSFLVVLPIAFVTGVILSSFAARLLAPLFVVHAAPSRRHLAGRVCEIRTTKVTADVGQAELATGSGAGLLIMVHCPKENDLKRGDLALIVDYDEEADSYLVEPVDWMEPGETIGPYKKQEIVEQLRQAGKL
jgi:hypothetical protein